MTKLTKLRKRKPKRMFLSADCIAITDKKGRPLIAIGALPKEFYKPKTVND